MDSIINTFHIDFKILIAQAINFGVVFTVLYLFALKPLKKLMAEREARIANGIEDAKCNAEILKSTRKEYNDILAKARTEAHEIFTEGKKEAEVKKAEMLARAGQEVEAMILSGKKSLESEKQKMVEEAKKEIVSLVVKATEKLLEEHDEKDLDEKIVKKIKKI